MSWEWRFSSPHQQPRHARFRQPCCDSSNKFLFTTVLHDSLPPPVLCQLSLQLSHNGSELSYKEVRYVTRPKLTQSLHRLPRHRPFKYILTTHRSPGLHRFSRPTLHPPSRPASILHPSCRRCILSLRGQEIQRCREVEASLPDGQAGGGAYRQGVQG